MDLVNATWHVADPTGRPRDSYTEPCGDLVQTSKGTQPSVDSRRESKDTYIETVQQTIYSYEALSSVTAPPSDIDEICFHSPSTDSFHNVTWLSPVLTASTLPVTDQLQQRPQSTEETPDRHANMQKRKYSAVPTAHT